MDPILNRSIPFDPRTAPRLPGTRPLGDAPWLVANEAHAAQMALRDRLVTEQRDAVVAMEPEAAPAAAELLEAVLAALPSGYAVAGDAATRPDGVRVPLDRGDPMGTLGRLVQEDLCILEKRGDEHVLTAAALCFPAQWLLGDKIGRPLVAIHVPVAAYDAALAPRVQRLFDGVRDGQPIWRSNLLWTDRPALHQAVRRDDHATKWSAGTAPYLRSERQVIRRLPESGAVVFSIHTYVLDSAAFRAAWDQAPTSCRIGDSIPCS